MVQLDLAPYPAPEHAIFDLPQGQLVKIICRVNKTYYLAVRDDFPVIAPADSEDPSQLWIKDCSHGDRASDCYGSPAFTLINVAAKKILKHSKEKGHQVVLVDYRPEFLDEDLLWTESQDFGEGFNTVRMASDPLLNMSIPHEEKNASHIKNRGKKLAPEVKQGTPVVLDAWHADEHQLWKLFPI